MFALSWVSACLEEARALRGRELLLFHGAFAPTLENNLEPLDAVNNACGLYAQGVGWTVGCDVGGARA